MLADSIEKFIDNDYDFDSRQKYAGSDIGYSAEVWQTFAELGWTAVPFSEDDGGFDGSPIDVMVLMERFGHGLIVEPYLANVVLAGGVLKRAASAEQKEQWLHPIIAGELQSALAFVEPQARYDISNIKTTASADGDHADGFPVDTRRCGGFQGQSPAFGAQTLPVQPPTGADSETTNATARLTWSCSCVERHSTKSG